MTMIPDGPVIRQVGSVPRYRLVGERVSFSPGIPGTPGTERISLALSQLDPIDWPQEQRDLWNRNGFGLGSMARDKVRLFFANLPRPVGVDEFWLEPSAELQAVAVLGRSVGPTRLALHGAAGPIEPREFDPGEFRFLLNLRPPDDAGTKLPIEFLPQHFLPRHTIAPRLPQEKMLDGRVFEELKAGGSLDREKVWVIWARRMPDAPVSGGQGSYKAVSDEEDEDEAHPLGAPAQTPDAPIPGRGPAARLGPPVNLAQATLTGTRLNQPVRVLLLIIWERIEPGVPAPNNARR